MVYSNIILLSINKLSLNREPNYESTLVKFMKYEYNLLITLSTKKNIFN